ncbi:hypothetical protein J3R82DRAFT_11807 [Butyriboletus roseoflavus]|nr:hypothetical protein J3R82DRAFT_11807 [Butyriboletus roseoflavus]
MDPNSTNNQIIQDTAQHSKPIPISTQHLRHRSTSFSSDSSSSSTSSPPLVTPNLPTTRVPTSAGSPILYFLSQSPSKAPSTFPFRGFAPPPVLEDDPAEEPTSAHARRASTNTVARFQPQPTVPELHHERGVNVLRRLSFGHLVKPPVADIPQPSSPHPPPNSAVSSSPITYNTLPSRKTRRSATVSGQARPRRAPSPMGERILKGHFDGFN